MIWYSIIIKKLKNSKLKKLQFDGWCYEDFEYPKKQWKVVFC